MIDFGKVNMLNISIYVLDFHIDRRKSVKKVSEMLNLTIPLYLSRFSNFISGAI